VTKMDMVWVAVANLLRPDTGSRRTVTREQIESEVSRLFRASIAQTMIDKHLVSALNRIKLTDRSQGEEAAATDTYSAPTTVQRRQRSGDLGYIRRQMDLMMKQIGAVLHILTAMISIASSVP
jgi:hypothetical protein